MHLSKELFTDVLVFKTNIITDEEVENVSRILAMKKNISKWTIDHEDIDNVLRIESDHLHPFTIIQLLRDAGFECDELPD